ncbi:hypothetical protein PR048_027588 [Dryococelus australis]|uniref:Uncharacterized protein n=1 Tax=Dryococelus australis TaxID=614101 RepID=A0ABQ9GGY7_9NEOP|nr:hypothetical protein PR048_027588 [Dryococelus australis]
MEELESIEGTVDIFVQLDIRTREGEHCPALEKVRRYSCVKKREISFSSAGGRQRANTKYMESGIRPLQGAMELLRLWPVADNQASPVVLIGISTAVSRPHVSHLLDPVTLSGGPHGKWPGSSDARHFWPQLPAMAAQSLSATMHVSLHDFLYRRKRLSPERQLAPDPNSNVRLTLIRWLDYFPPTMDRVRLPAGSPPDFLMWESCRIMPLVDEFSQGTSRFPLPFIPSMLHPHVNVKSRPNLFTQQLPGSLNGKFLKANDRTHQKEIKISQHSPDKIIDRKLTDIVLWEHTAPQDQQLFPTADFHGGDAALVRPADLPGVTKRCGRAPKSNQARAPQPRQPLPCHLLAKASMKQRRNARTGETEDPRENPPTSGTIPKCEDPGATLPGIEPGSPRWDASSLTTKPPRPHIRL